MSNKFTFTYEYVPNASVKYQDTSKRTSVLVIEDVEDLQSVLEATKNFLSSVGYAFNAKEYLAVVSDENIEKSESTTSYKEKTDSLTKIELASDMC